MLRSTPEYITVHMADIAGQAPSRDVKEFLAQRRAEKWQKRRHLVASIPRAMSRILPIGATERPGGTLIPDIDSGPFEATPLELVGL